MPSPIEIISGSVTTRGAGSLRIVAFSRPSAKGRENPLHIAIKDEHSGIKSAGQPDIIQSGQARVGQVWAKNRYMAENGVFVKICLTKSGGGGGAFGFGQHNIMIKVRDAGPLYRIAIDLPNDAHSRMTVGYIEGRFDILTVKQLKELGVDRNAQGASEIQSYGEIDFVTVTEIEPEIKADDRIKVKAVPSTKAKEADAGGGKVLLKRRRVRRIGA